MGVGLQMQGRSPEDEVSRRRALRERLRSSDPGPDADEEEELPKLGWSDTFAMIIAAYQVLLPMLLLMIGVMVAAYLLFRFIFS